MTKLQSTKASRTVPLGFLIALSVCALLFAFSMKSYIRGDAPHKANNLEYRSGIVGHYTCEIVRGRRGQLDASYVFYTRAGEIMQVTVYKKDRCEDLQGGSVIRAYYAGRTPVSFDVGEKKLLNFGTIKFGENFALTVIWLIPTIATLVAFAGWRNRERRRLAEQDVSRDQST